MDTVVNEVTPPGGRNPEHVDPAAHNQAGLEGSEALGHTRAEVTSYCGPHGHKPRRLTPAFLAELDRIFERHNGKAHDRSGKIKRDCSSATRDHRRTEIRTVFSDLAGLGYPLRHPENLGMRHLDCLAKHWRDKGLTPQTLNRRFSMLRVFCTWLGKRQIVRDLCDYYPDDPSVYKRTGIAKMNRSWEANQVDPLKMIEQAKAIDERYGLYLALQHHFGLRVKESIQLEPLRSATDKLDVLEVFAGTKGGRPRVVPITTAEQREVVEWAKRVAEQTRGSRIRWPGLNWVQAQKKFYNLMDRRLGMTRKKLGVTAHGARHGFAQREYTAKCGMTTPIEGMDPKQVDPKAHKQACLEVSWELGHGRTEVTSFYYGSHGHKLRQPRTFVAQGAAA